MTRPALAPSLALVVALASAACGPTDPSSGADSLAAGGEDPASLPGSVFPDYWVTVTAAAPVCVDGASGSVTLAGTVTSSVAPQPTTVWASVDGGAMAAIDVVAPAAFTRSGDLFVAPYAVPVSLYNGAHAVTLCFAQPSVDGEPAQQVCADPVRVTVACDTCGPPEFFGDLVSNPSLCRGEGAARVPIHLRGDFGPEARLAIVGPNGFRHDAAMRRAGQSCNYQYVWSPAPGMTSGEYLFIATGNGVSARATASLACR
ncbi:MAG: hypothetical protein R3A52_29815 [Polyangiales bacterium]